MRHPLDLSLVLAALLVVLRRAAVNQAMREFVNDVAPDPLACAGEKREPVLVAVTRSICWAISRSWGELPELTEGQNCGEELPGLGSRVALDDFVVISHSLGSRAVLDAIQRLTNLPMGTDPRLQRIADNFRDRFSDPNDLMSCAVPDRFADRYIESRLCPSVTNVTINVVPVSSLFGLGDVANPLGAHLGYAADERVGGLMARGAGHPGVAPIVAERCTWRAVDESLMR